MILFRCDRCVLKGIKSEAETDNTRYKDRVSTFEFDYCTENPAFSKFGHLKLIDYKILMGKPEQFEKLNALKA